MRKLLYLNSLLIVLFIVGCSSSSSLGEPTEELTETPTLVPMPEPTEIVRPPDHCVECHTDKEKLVAVAEPEEDTESKSSGVG